MAWGRRVQDLALAFADHLRRDRRRSVHTIRPYQGAGERLIGFLEGHWGGPLSSEALKLLSSADLRAYLAQRRGEGLGNASAARELSAVRGFLAFAGGATPRLK